MRIFAIDNCICRFCLGSLNKKIDSDNEIDFACKNCGEHFILYFYRRTDINNIIKCNSITFSCNDLYFYIAYDNEDKFYVRHCDSFYWKSIPSFEINLLDKEKFYNKLKMYLLFS